MTKNYLNSKTRFFLFFVFALAFLSHGKSASAQVDLCDPDKQVFGDNAIHPLDIRRTTANLSDSVVVYGLKETTGGTSEQLIGCAVKGINDAEATAGGDLNIGDDAITSCTQYDAAFCESLKNSYTDPGAVVYKDDPMYHYGRAGLLGLAVKMEEATFVPAPLNMAFYVSKKLENVPIAQRALAQSPEDYAGPFLQIVYDFWVLSRNAALGIMAVIMVVAGVMIMTRKKISPQMSVSLQYAIPRIVIALILITFSYAIGAGIASFAWVLRNSPQAVILDLANSAGGGLSTLDGALVIAAGGIATNIAIAFAVQAFVPGAGTVFLVIVVIAMILVLILYIWAQLTMLILYVKLTIHVILAPLTFAMGSVPGKDSVTINWFKRAVSYVAGIFSVAVGIQVTQLAASALLINSGSSFGGLVISALLAPILLFAVLSYGFTQSRKLPQKIDAAIMGAPKR